jgi:hypothetical protein
MHKTRKYILIELKQMPDGSVSTFTKSNLYPYEILGLIKTLELHTIADLNRRQQEIFKENQ